MASGTFLPAGQRPGPPSHSSLQRPYDSPICRDTRGGAGPRFWGEFTSPDLRRDLGGAHQPQQGLRVEPHLEIWLLSKRSRENASPCPPPPLSHGSTAALPPDVAVVSRDLGRLRVGRDGSGSGLARPGPRRRELLRRVEVVGVTCCSPPAPAPVGPAAPARARSHALRARPARRHRSPPQLQYLGPGRPCARWLA